MAAAEAVTNTEWRASLERVLGDSPAFFTFERSMLAEDWGPLPAPERTIVELADSVPAEQNVFTLCERLRQKGFAVALRAWRNDSRASAFAPFIDILKVDFRVASPDERAALVKRYRELQLRLVAENVETDAEFQAASRLGYDYFQGLFFASPSVLRTSHVPVTNPGSLRLLKLVQQEELDFDAIGKVVRHDIGFSHSLLKYLNSAAFHWASRIESVSQALFLLGSNGIRKWVWMASVPALAQNRPPVLVSQVLMRGRFCELLAERAGISRDETDPFLAGMFSLLDAILPKSLPEILDELSIGESVRKSLLGMAGEDDPLSNALGIVKAYERADFEGIEGAAKRLQLSTAEMNRCYLEGLQWVRSFIANYEHTWPATRASDRTGFRRPKQPPKAAPGWRERVSVR
ncbi:MAG: HDOD domain-containing protein [Acidobacteriota bacterium]|nr:HDOD domain-containing protein [Acidobacteriota bacterium]